MEIDHINLMREMNRKILTHFKDHKDCDRIAEVTIAYLSQTIDECKYGSDGILVKLNKANVIKSVCEHNGQVEGNVIRCTKCKIALCLYEQTVL
jgi:hypothetical protein